MENALPSTSSSPVSSVSLDQSLLSVAESLFASEMLQREAFLAPHFDKRFTHNLALYPRREIRNGSTTLFQLPIALLPKNEHRAITEDEARANYPYCLVETSLTVAFDSLFSLLPAGESFFQRAHRYGIF